MTLDGAVLAYPVYAMCVVVALVCYRLDVLVNRTDREQRVRVAVQRSVDLEAHWARLASEPPQFVVEEVP